MCETTNPFVKTIFQMISHKVMFKHNTVLCSFRISKYRCCCNTLLAVTEYTASVQSFIPFLSKVFDPSQTCNHLRLTGANKTINIHYRNW